MNSSTLERKVLWTSGGQDAGSYRFPSRPELLAFSIHPMVPAVLPVPVRGVVQSVCYWAEAAPKLAFGLSTVELDTASSLCHQAHSGKADQYRLLARSEEHTSELQSLRHLVCRLLLEK